MKNSIKLWKRLIKSWFLVRRMHVFICALKHAEQWSCVMLYWPTSKWQIDLVEITLAGMNWSVEQFQPYFECWWRASVPTVWGCRYKLNDLKVSEHSYMFASKVKLWPLHETILISPNLSYIAWWIKTPIHQPLFMIIQFLIIA